MARNLPEKATVLLTKSFCHNFPKIVGQSHITKPHLHDMVCHHHHRHHHHHPHHHHCHRHHLCHLTHHHHHYHLTSGTEQIALAKEKVLSLAMLTTSSRARHLHSKIGIGRADK